MTHLGYIVAAYAAAAAAFCGLVLWVVFDLATQRRRLAELEASGRGRRSRGEGS